MYKIFLVGLMGLFSSIFANDKLNIVVSIVPQKTFVKAIGQDRVDITVMVKPKNSPHTYEPKPSQMKNLSKANIYFAIGVEFEKSWLDKFKNQNKQLIVEDLSKNIKKENDPHIWTNPNNVKIIATNIYKTLSKIDTKNSLFYRQNLDKFLIKLDTLDKQIKTTLQCIPKKSKFMVFHPAWGHFAKQYNLTQISIEVDGKKPKPKALINLIKEAKKQHIKTIFTQPEFSSKTAKLIAKELNIKVVKTTALNPNYINNLQNFSKALCP